MVRRVIASLVWLACFLGLNMRSRSVLAESSDELSNPNSTELLDSRAEGESSSKSPTKENAVEPPAKHDSETKHKDLDEVPLSPPPSKPETVAARTRGNLTEAKPPSEVRDPLEINTLTSKLQQEKPDEQIQSLTPLPAKSGDKAAGGEIISTPTTIVDDLTPVDVGASVKTAPTDRTSSSKVPPASESNKPAATDIITNDLKTSGAPSTPANPSSKSAEKSAPNSDKIPDRVDAKPLNLKHSAPQANDQISSGGTPALDDGDDNVEAETEGGQKPGTSKLILPAIIASVVIGVAVFVFVGIRSRRNKYEDEYRDESLDPTSVNFMNQQAPTLAPKQNMMSTSRTISHTSNTEFSSHQVTSPSRRANPYATLSARGSTLQRNTLPYNNRDSYSAPSQFNDKAIRPSYTRDSSAVGVTL